MFEQPLFIPPCYRSTDQYLDPNKHILFPGSFDPIHYGHLYMAKEASVFYNKDVIFAITTTHPNKGILSESECWKRASLILREGFSVLFTEKDELFAEKFQKFVNFTFIVGMDTLDRMFDCKYGVNDLSKIIIDNNIKIGYFNKIIKNDLGYYWKIDQSNVNKNYINFDYLGRTFSISSTEMRKNYVKW